MLYIGIICLSSNVLMAYQQPIDSLKRVISKETNEIKLANTMLDLATEQFGKDFKEVELLIERADSLFFKNSDKAGLARTLNLKGNFFKFNYKNDEALKCYYNSLKINTQIGNVKGLINNYGNIGQMYAEMEEYDEAIKFAYKSLTACRSINYQKGISWAYYDIAHTYFIKKNFDSADYYFQKLNVHSKSIKHLIGEGLSLIGLSELLFAKNDSVKAIKLLDSAIDKFIITGNDYYLALCYNMIANAFIITKDFENAHRTFMLSKGIAERLSRPDILKESLSGLAKLHAADGNYKEAYSNYLQSDLIEDSLLRIQNSLSLSNLNRKYLKDKVLKDNQILKQNIELQNQSRNILIIILIALLILFLFLIFRFIEKNKMNQAILASNYELSAVNSTKDKFFSIIAHDLKGPLGNFKEMTKMLYDDYVSFDEEERKEFLQIIKSSSENIYLLLENLLEWSRSQRGLIKFNSDNFNLYSVVINCMEVLSLSAINKNVSLVNNIPSDFVINADTKLITTIIRNLLSNAIKFTPEGGFVEIGTIDGGNNLDNSNKSCTIYVKDNGVGMSKDMIDKLFRIDTSVMCLGTLGESGTGLGLILCKEFIEMHNGKIWVESEVGRGSTFYFSLPINNQNIKHQIVKQGL